MRGLHLLGIMIEDNERGKVLNIETENVETEESKILDKTEAE